MKDLRDFTDLTIKGYPSLEFMIQGSWSSVQGPGLRNQGSGFRVQGRGFRVQGSGSRRRGWGFGNGGFERARLVEIRQALISTRPPVEPTPLSLFYRGTSLIRKRPTPQDPPRTLGKGYGRVLGGCGFL